MMQATKIQVRAKSRSGITSAAFRFDVGDAAKTAAIKLEDDDLREGDLASKLKDLASKWWQNFKNYVIGFYERNISKMISDAASELEVSIT